MHSDFSHEIRVLMCLQCGAPLDAETGGCRIKCDYCGVVNEIMPRQPETQLQHAAISEEERMHRLWAQNGKSIPPPDAVKKLLSGGFLKKKKLEEAIKLFNSTRQELEAGDNFAASERLTHLVLVLYNYYVQAKDTKRQRAILESAVEALRLPHHKQYALGILCRCAVKDNDLQAAKEWLKTCDPHSDDLQADTSYRIGRALIDTAEGRFDKVHLVLGEGAQDVPIADGFYEVALVLRANAWEKRGHLDKARSLIKGYSGAYGSKVFKFVSDIYPHLQLCQQSMPWGGAERSQTQTGCD